MVVELMVSGNGAVARLKDVADAAGVSIATVSRYLAGSLVTRPETAARIDDAVRRLKYQPNPHALRLSRGRTDTIGLMVPNIANPFFARLAAEIESVADSVGYGLVLCVTMNRPGRELEYLDRLKRNHIDGLIFMTNHVGSRVLAREINEAGSVVLVDEDVEGARVPKIFCDNESGGYLAARHLVEAGHRKLAFVGGPQRMLTTRERLAGYRRAISEAGPGVRSVGEFMGVYDMAQGHAATQELVTSGKPFSAIFFSSDATLMGGMEVLHRHSIAVPGDVSIVTFDDVEPLHLFSPPVTAVRQPLMEMGRRSVEATLSQARARSVFVERLPVSLVVRSSVSPPVGLRTKTWNSKRRDRTPDWGRTP
jgi:LacI family transcriptional regulator